MANVFFKRLLGDQYIDFFIYTKPVPTILRVMSKYWHGRTTAEDSYNRIRLLAKFKGRVKIIDVWDYDIKNVDDAMAFLRENVL